jgi:predicted small lipoprotein YifL
MRFTVSLFSFLSLGLIGCGIRGPSEAPVAKKTPAKQSERQASAAKQDAPKTDKGPSAAKSNSKDHRSWHDPSEEWLPPLGAASGPLYTGAGGGTWSGGRSFTEASALESSLGSPDPGRLAV